MDRSVFTADQRDIALDAIRRIEPDFTPIYTPPVINYNNNLLNDLNESILPMDDISSNKVSSKTIRNVMQHKRAYSKAELEKMAREQLKIELDGSITIKSIESSSEFSNAEFCVSL